ncbi:hypothetical protein [Paraburkholderia elongata]|uniref:Uncharacterized protein n=1 Tax=Paraburkholderia elongata TaxID=2675747 RepID=A0A972NZM8_9BURK|nr:hypothetical protein [Paraburkholderia elongata]NPT61419.1 hypothetical protein [Paraburkholderia elongata]
MIDDQVNAEELAESKKQREAAETATDDGMPVVPEGKAGDVKVIQYRTPKQWMKYAMKWPGEGGSPLQSGRSVMVRRKPDLP